jgi:hypothetical protein
VVGTVRQLGLDHLLATRSSREKDLALALVAGRVLHPGSKLSLSRLCAPDSRVSTLAQVLGVEGADENELYAAMDWLEARQQLAIQGAGSGRPCVHDDPSPPELRG